MASQESPQFHVFSGHQVHQALDGQEAAVMDVVERAYRAHHHARTINPDSYFLRFPKAPQNCIIALPAHIEGDDAIGATGIKWISSFPGNIDAGLPRASAALILNDSQSGYPIACMEASIISASRTAASAVSALRLLSNGRKDPITIAFVGTGLIARYVCKFLHRSGLRMDGLVLHDLVPSYADALASRLTSEMAVPVRVESSLERAIRCADVVVFTTTSAEPYVTDVDWLSHAPIVLHLSLRDLAPDLILAAHNVVDDADHCLKARTSLHLAEMQVDNRDFVTTTLPALLCGAAAPTHDRPIIVSPFGMGILDIALAKLVYDTLAPDLEPVQRFFFDMARA